MPSAVEGPGVGSRWGRAVFSDHPLLSWVWLFRPWASLDSRPCHPLPPYSPPKTIPILAAAGHRERFLPSLPLLLFLSHSHSLSMNPLCCISSITFLSPSCSLLMGCPAPSIPSPQLVSPPFLHQPLSCRIFILSLSFSFSCCPWHHRQGQVPVPEG